MKRSHLNGLAVAFAAGLTALAGTTLAADTWELDTAHSSVGFKVRHIVSNVPGRFTTFDGTITMDGDKVETAVIDVEIDAASVNTSNEKRDAHLKSADFFDVANNPKIVFKSTGVKPTDATTGQVTGELTIRGVTKPVTLDYTILGFGKDPWGNDRGGFEATGKLNRKDFGVNWNKALDNGGFLLGDEVTLLLTAEAVKAKPEAGK